MVEVLPAESTTKTTNKSPATTEGRLKGNYNRRSQVTEMLELQAVMHRIVTTAIQQLDGQGELCSVPARELASCAAAWVKLEAQRRAALGLANPKPIESTPRKSKSTSPVRPSFSEP